MAAVDTLNNTSYKKARKHYLKSTRHRPPDEAFDWTPFRAAEKKYKARFPQPDLSNVIDLALLDPSRENEVNSGRWKGKVPTDEVMEVGLRMDSTESSERLVKAYCLRDMPGMCARCMDALDCIDKQLLSSQGLSFSRVISRTHNSVILCTGP